MHPAFSTKSHNFGLITGFFDILVLFLIAPITVMDNLYSIRRKREFIKKGLVCTGGMILATNPVWSGFSYDESVPVPDLRFSTKPGKYSKEAMFQVQTPKGIRCMICPEECNILDGASGNCGSRKNFGNKLYSIAYGNPCTVNIDPVEKKPLLHFLPESLAYSIATAGCNLACLNCQNWTISQTTPDKTRNEDLMPEKVVSEALKNQCKSIAYTYSEPITFYEYTHDTSRLARAKGLKNILVSNGYIHEEPLRELASYIDGANINLKSFSEEIYTKLNNGKLQPVLNTLKTLKEMNVWLEITNLIIPGWTDDFAMISRMCGWLSMNGFSDNPLHFLRFHPEYRLTQVPATPLDTLEKAREIAQKAGLHYVYIGNVANTTAENTYCPQCGKTLVERKGFRTLTNAIIAGKCKYCAQIIPGRWT
jgi:pyruvate formate lyase activating enzyme